MVPSEDAGARKEWHLMKVEIRPIPDPLWLDFLSKQENANIFHHPAWAGLLAECYGYRPFVLLSLDEGGRRKGEWKFIGEPANWTCSFSMKY